MVENRGPRYILLSWDEPAYPNGILTTYTVLVDDEVVADVLPPTVEYNVTGLLPFTEYRFAVLACTAVGCVESPSVDAMTLEDGMFIRLVYILLPLYLNLFHLSCLSNLTDKPHCHHLSIFTVFVYILFTHSVPEGVPAPTLNDGVPGQVIVTWQPPDQPNGEILYYLVERAQGDEEYSLLFNVTADSVPIFGDLSVEPYTEYEYRIVAVNSAGSASGPATTILTPEAG